MGSFSDDMPDGYPICILLFAFQFNKAGNVGMWECENVRMWVVNQ